MHVYVYVHTHMCSFTYILILIMVKNSWLFYWLKCLMLNCRGDHLKKAYLPETLDLVPVQLNFIAWLIHFTKEILDLPLSKTELIR